jgi:hypothetical protein
VLDKVITLAGFLGEGSAQLRMSNKWPDGDTAEIPAWVSVDIGPREERQKNDR